MLKLRFLIGITVFLASSKAIASHIVGGNIQYEYLGGNKYKLIFKIYRDCSSSTMFDGDPSGSRAYNFYYGIFENNVDINVFSSSARSLSLISKKNIDPIIRNYCLIPNNSCVEEGIYETTVNLPKNDVGYTIIHQRCCRNDGIKNILPLNGSNNTMPGITIKCYIPPLSTHPNNSAVFKNFPPIFICKDQPFYFDHSATDADGDSLRYFLNNPIGGLSESQPLSSHQSLSDNSPVSWRSPYSLANVMGGSPVLTIDSLTGFLSCKPNLNGRFVASVIVVEYRNGSPIDTLNRDFQFNVVDCDIPKADMPFLPGTMDPNNNIATYKYTFCDTLLVKFKNTSSNSLYYVWDFGDPSTGSENFSTEFEPSHKYSDTGTFLIQLIAMKININGDTCKDSTRRLVRVFPRFQANFQFQNACPDSTILFKDLSHSQYGLTEKWHWDFGDGNTSTLAKPSHKYKQGGQYKITLIASDTKSCTDDTSLTVTIHQKPTFVNTLPKFCLSQSKTIESSVIISPPDSINLYRWSYLGRDSFGSSFTHTMTSDTPIPISLYITTDKGCQFKKEYVLSTFPNPRPPMFLDSIFLKCNENFLCGISDPMALSYIWSDGSRDPNRQFKISGKYYFTIKYPCLIHNDSFVIYTNKLNADFSYTPKCEGELIHFENETRSKLSSVLTHQWEIEKFYINSLHLRYAFKNANNARVKLTVSDEFGCLDSIIKQITVFPKPKISLNIPKLCPKDSQNLIPFLSLPTAHPPFQFFWTVNDKLVGQDSIYTHTASSHEPIPISLKVVNSLGCADSILEMALVHPSPKPKKIQDSFFIGCADSIYIDIFDSLALRYQWDNMMKDSVRYINYPGKFSYTIEYPCTEYNDSFKVHNSCTIDVPRAFSPNGDGKNDKLFIRGYHIKKLISFKIYNRLGQLLFFTQNPNEGWDGQYKGLEQNSEVYFYTYEAITHANGAITGGQGQFLLLR